MDSLAQTVRSFRRLQVLVLGDVMLDSYLEGTADRLSSEGPVPVVRKTAVRKSPGGAANAAANLVGLGAGVRLVGLVGRDQAGAELRSELLRRGVDDSHLVEDPTLETIHKARVLADGQHVVRVDKGQVRFAAGDARRRLHAELQAQIERSDVVVVSDYSAGTVDDSTLAQIVRHRRDRPMPLVVDAKDLAKYRGAGATVVTPNLKEGLAVLDVGGGKHGPAVVGGLDLGSVEDLAGRLADELQVEHVALTLAEHGVMLRSRSGRSWHLPARRVAEPDVVGAGDTFTAALALALGAGMEIEAGARLALVACGLAVEKRHTAAVQAQELTEELRRGTKRRRRHPGVTAELGDPRSLAALETTLGEDRREGKSVVFTNGVFDIVHAGHVQFLRRAKELGDVLVVGVNSDRSVRRLKGKERPINSERDRLALIAALDPVDHVVLFDEDTPAQLIRRLRPHVHVKGGDYADRRLPEAAAVEEVGARTVILPRIGSHSTTQVIDRIVATTNPER